MVASKMAQADSLTAQYIRLRDTADVHRDWSARAIAVGLRSHILLLRNDRDHWERQLARLEGRPPRTFHGSSLPPPIDGDVRILVGGRNADSLVVPPGGSVQFQAQHDSGDVGH
jgi:hypothetical protein